MRQWKAIRPISEVNHVPANIYLWVNSDRCSSRRTTVKIAVRVLMVVVGLTLCGLSVLAQAKGAGKRAPVAPDSASRSGSAAEVKRRNRPTSEHKASAS